MGKLTKILEIILIIFGCIFIVYGDIDRAILALVVSMVARLHK